MAFFVALPIHSREREKDYFTMLNYTHNIGGAYKQTV